MNKSISRTLPIHEIDPNLAWETWEPSESEPWDAQRACLLARRAGFGATHDQIKSMIESGHRGLIERFLGDEGLKKNAVFEEESALLANAVLAASDVKQLAAWWIHRMLNSPRPLIEKMTLFWHGHFATGAEKVLDSELMYAQNQLLRGNALGDFRALVHGIAKDPAMLIYLDSVSNRKAHANENFARELMELFCLGEGNYSEADVQQLARCFTGYEIRRKQFRFNPYQHDTSTKTLLGTSDLQTGDQAIDVVLASPHMPNFIVRKIFRFFISEDINPSDRFLEPLAVRFAESKFSIQEVVKMILGSRIMLSGWSIGKKIRSPIELMVGWMQLMECTTNLSFLSEKLKALGQSLLYPPNVKGWEGGRAWINSSTLVGRANLIFDVVHHENTRYGSTQLSTFVQRVNSNSVPDFLERF